MLSDNSGIRTISPRPRSVAAHSRVLETVDSLLSREGLAAVTVERIARESGVSTATIYKHWPSKVAIAAESFGRVVSRALPVHATDDPVADLVAAATDVMFFYAHQDRGVFLDLLAACRDEEDGASYLREFLLRPRRRLLEPLWTRAVDRGLVRRDIDPDTAFDVLFGTAVFALQTRHVGPGRSDVGDIIQLSLRGVLA